MKRIGSCAMVGLEQGTQGLRWLGGPRRGGAAPRGQSPPPGTLQPGTASWGERSGSASQGGWVGVPRTPVTDKDWTGGALGCGERLDPPHHRKSQLLGTEGRLDSAQPPLWGPGPLSRGSPTPFLPWLSLTHFLLTATVTAQGPLGNAHSLTPTPRAAPTGTRTAAPQPPTEATLNPTQEAEKRHRTPTDGRGAPSEPALSCFCFSATAHTPCLHSSSPLLSPHTHFLLPHLSPAAVPLLQSPACLCACLCFESGKSEADCLVCRGQAGQLTPPWTVGGSCTLWNPPPPQTLWSLLELAGYSPVPAANPPHLVPWALRLWAAPPQPGQVNVVVLGLSTPS